MVGATSKRFAVVLAGALVALSFVSDGGPALAVPTDRSAQVASVWLVPGSPTPDVRPQHAVGTWTLRANRPGGYRSTLVLALLSLLCPLTLDSTTVSRRPRRPWTEPGHHRATVSLRAPPLAC